jgi:hypothetical protein
MCRLLISLLTCLKACCEYSHYQPVMALSPSLKALKQGYEALLTSPEPHIQLVRVFSDGFRHLVGDAEAVRGYLEIGMVGVMWDSVGRFGRVKEVALNWLRVMARISEEEESSGRLLQLPDLVQTLCSQMRQHRADVHFVTRVTTILANLTSYD